MTSKADANASVDVNASADLIAALNSRGPLVHAGRVRIQDVMNAAQKSIASYAKTTESNAGPILNGVSERTFQEALMQVLAGVNTNQAINARLPF